MEQIKFKQLSGWLKSAVIISWICGGLLGCAFLVGFIQGIINSVH